MRKVKTEIEPFSMAPRHSISGVSFRVVHGECVPAVCVKIPPLYDRLPADVRGKDSNSRVFNAVTWEWWEDVPQETAETCFRAAFPGCLPLPFADGRSSGWLCVSGLGDPRAWNKRQIAAWGRYEEKIKASMRTYEAKYVERVRASEKTPLDLLEELLALTEGVKNSLSASDRDVWLRISATCADLREGT